MRFEWMCKQETQHVASEISQVYIELSTACNLTCTTCVRYSINGFAITHIKELLMAKIIAQLRKLQSLQRIVLLGFGEALCHPDLQRYLVELATLKVPIVLVTNGMLIEKTLAEFFVNLPLDVVYISIDDTAGVMPAIRRGSDVAVPLAAIEMINKIKKEKKSHKPLIGIESVATTHNVEAIQKIVSEAKKAGAESFVLSNVYPYTESMKNAIVYSRDGKYDGLKKLRAMFKRDSNVVVAGSSASVLRCCSFIEKGTLFITVNGDVAPCPELAYTHTSYYFGNPRVHIQHRFGNLGKDSINNIWDSEEFTRFRDTFRYYEFPDCSLCIEPDMCYHRTVENKDCYWNTSPCGECLWAKGIVLCP